MTRKLLNVNTKRKNYLPTLLATMFLLGIDVAIVYFTDPSNILNLTAFLLVTFAACTFIFSIVLLNTKRGILVSLGVIIFLMLRYLGVGNILNALLLAGVLIAINIFLNSKQA